MYVLILQQLFMIPSTHHSSRHSMEDQQQQFQILPRNLPVLPQKTQNLKQVVVDPPQQKIPLLFKTQTQSPTTSSSYLTDDLLIALGLQNGQIDVIQSQQGKFRYLLKSNDKSPVSSISLNPDHTVIKNAILLTHVNGTLQYWHTTSKQILFQKNYQQFLYCCQICPDGTKYAFGADNGMLRISNMDKGNPVLLEQGHIGSHTNRIFAVKWDKQNPNILVSGGWDKSILFWDVRCKFSVKKLFGFYVGGKSIDMMDDNLLLGSNSSEYPLRIYDIKAQKVHSVDWFHFSEASLNSASGIVSAAFTQKNLRYRLKNSKSYILQTARNEVRIYYNDKCICWRQKDEDVKGFSMSHANFKKEFIVTWNNRQSEILTYE